MDEASTRGAEGDADGHLALAAIGLGEEQICDVGAGNAENEESYDHQNDEEGDDCGAVAWRKGSGLLEGELEVFFRGGVGFGEVLGERGEFGGGLIARDAGFEPSGYGDPVKETGVVVGERGDELVDIAEGDPELGIEQEIDAAKGWRGHADDGVGASGEGDGFAEDVGVGGEAMLPETIAEDDDGGLFFGGEEAAAEGHAELSDVEKVGGGGLSPDSLGLACAADGGGNEVVVAGHVGEGSGLVAEIVV